MPENPGVLFADIALPAQPNAVDIVPEEASRCNIVTPDAIGSAPVVTRCGLTTISGGIEVCSV